MIRTFLPGWLVVLSLLLLGPALAQDEELLDPEDAFALTAEVVDAENIRLRWQVAPGYYLYRDRMQLRSDTAGVELGAAQFPTGKIKDDEFFGKVEIYRGTVEVLVPLVREAGVDSLRLIAVSQGCADIGVCYTPHTQTRDLALPAAAPTGAIAVEKGGPLAALSDLGKSLGLGGGDDEFLPPEEAFQFSAEVVDPNTLIARWKIVDGYYLYRDKFGFNLIDPVPEGVSLGQPQFPAGKIKDDELFGRVEVYTEDMEVRIPLLRSNLEPTEINLQVAHQGCAEAGICYPPQKSSALLMLPAAAAASGPATSAPAPTSPVSAPKVPVTETDRIASYLAEGNVPVILATFLGFGLLLAFTPCVFPMVPILSGIIIGQGSNITTRKAFTLSLAYVLAMALTYTAAGVIAGMTGESLQAAFQNPWILSTFAVIFVLLSLSMFGFYELQMPQAIQSRLTEWSNRQQGGTLIGAAIMGFLSALIVGPCVAAPLAGALIYIGQTGDPVLGGMALFALSLGMGLPLLAIGTGTGKLLPKAGGWMEAVKGVFGVLLLAVAVWMLERIVPAAISMSLWAALLIISAVYMGAMDSLPEESTGWRKLWKGIGLIMMAYGALILVGVASGGKDVFQPLRGTALMGSGTHAATPAEVHFKVIKSSEDLDRELAMAGSKGQSVMLDFYADWCTDCKRMEKYTFTDPTVIALLDSVVTLKADVTANDDVDKTLLKRFSIPGPPSIILFGKDGKELREYRVVGYMDAPEFHAHVSAALGR